MPATGSAAPAGPRRPRAAGELAVYPSALLSLAKGRRPDRLPWESLIDNRPRGLAEVPLDVRWAEIDITELYRTWAGGREFPSKVASTRKRLNASMTRATYRLQRT